MSLAIRFFVAAVFLFVVAETFAGAPTDQIKESIDDIMSVLAEELPAEQARSRIADILGRRFDYPEMSKRALGRHWKGLSSAQQEEFSGLFRQLLERTYLSHISAEAKAEVKYGKERLSKKGNKAKVPVKLVSKGQEIPLVYSVLQKDSGWFIYDVQIEGVGLVKNYRTNFNSILAKEPYSVLLERLRDKVSTPVPGA